MTTNRYPYPLLFVLILCWGMGCDNGNPVIEQGTPADTVALAPQEQVRLEVNDVHVTVDANGALFGGQWQEVPGETVYGAGLWVGGVIGGAPRGSLYLYETTNYVAPDGVYHLTSEQQAAYITNWPEAAPTDAFGRPFLLGDAMTWATLMPKPRTPGRRGTRLGQVFGAPVETLRIGQSVFASDDPALDDVFFLRYDLTNAGETSLGGLYAGLFTDTDVYGCLFGPGSNGTGYDLDRALSYTYPALARGDSTRMNGQGEACTVPVAGFAFLLSPQGQPPAPVAYSHRIFRKNDYVQRAFSERYTEDPQDVVWALQGLSVEGEPMIDPTTEAPSRFAFTGDPVALTGWLDDQEPVDVRSLLSAGPFDLAPGETKHLVIAWAAAEGDVLSEALATLRTRIDAARDARSLWMPR